MAKSFSAMDLFAGGGGLTVGLKQAGFRVVGAIELCPLATETYRRNHRKPYIWNKSISDVSTDEVMHKLGIQKGELDLLAGCPPCQGFSNIRTRNGKLSINDPRNDLIFEFQRFVVELLPKAVMMENVPGLSKDARLVKFVEKLQSLGYWVEHKVLDVALYGVPQRRRRTVLLAARNLAVTWPEPATELVTVRKIIGDLPKPGLLGDPLHDLQRRHSEKVTALIKKIPRNGGSRSDLSLDEQLPCHRRISGFFDVYGRMAWDDVAPTITSGCINPSKGRFIHPSQNRAITLREAALLQGFPPNYWFSTKKGIESVAEMIGNALPPEFARRHAAKIRSLLIKSKTKLGKEANAINSGSP